MNRDISRFNAERLERTAPEENTFMAYVNENGTPYASLELDARALRLWPGRIQQVRAVPYRMGVRAGEPVAHPVTLPNGRAACVLVGVRAEPGQDFAHVDVRASLPSLADAWAKVVVERVRAPRARVAAAGVAALAVTAGLALATWSDPAAKRGHDEGKTDEEIQADLDADVAWYAMEISVPSAMTVPEGETTTHPGRDPHQHAAARPPLGRGRLHVRRPRDPASRGRPARPPRRHACAGLSERALSGLGESWRA